MKERKKEKKAFVNFKVKRLFIEYAVIFSLHTHETSSIIVNIFWYMRETTTNL